ncbi:MAG: aspartate aminotransferase family protein, partial [Nocardioides sp.]|nr:aspartate aminotransferase family protein [Nocardioides sp.]
LHKYGYTPKGASILLHRTPADRKPTYFASAAWPGYTMLNTTMQSTKPGGPLAGAWVTVQSIGHEGYLDLARACLDAADLIVAGVDELEGVDLVVRPDSSLIALYADDTCDVFTIADEMVERGWYVQPQMSWHGRPPTLHLSVSAATLPLVDECLAALGESVATAQECGPVEVDRNILQILRTLRPEKLTDEDFDALLQAAGLAGESGVVTLPKRMAQINVLLNAAGPALREALLVAYLDRLFRPVRS